MSLTNLKTGLRALLKDDATLKGYAGSSTDFVFDKLAPERAVYPFVTIHVQTWEDEYTLSARAHTTYSVAIDCWDTERNGSLDSGTITNMADRIDALLTDGSLSVSGKTVRYVRREAGSDELVTDEADGTAYISISSTYMIELQ